MQPLYIDGNKIHRIEWEHDALKLVSHSQSPLWIPIHKVSYIAVFNQVDWEGKALQACMQKSISISYSNTQGYVGFTSGKNNPQAHLHSQLVQLFLQHSDKLSNWFSGIKQTRLKQLCQRFHLEKYSVSKQAVEKELDQIIALHYHYYRWRNDLDILKTLLITQQYHLLPYYGFSQSQLQQYKPLNQFLNHLVELSVWEYWQYAAQGDLPKSSSNKHLVAYYHQHQIKTESLSRYYINSFWTTLSDF